MYLAQTIDASQTPIIIGNFLPDGDVIARMPGGDIYRLNRFYITTPVLCCQMCRLPMVNVTKNRQKMVECPDHARHMYEECFVESQNIDKNNHRTRRIMYQQAKRWLKVWLRVLEGRTEKVMQIKAKLADEQKLQERLDEIEQINDVAQPSVIVAPDTEDEFTNG